MNDGLLLLAAWGQWLLVVGVLVVFVARNVADEAHRVPPTYERDRSDPGGAPEG